MKRPTMRLAAVLFLLPILAVAAPLQRTYFAFGSDELRATDRWAIAKLAMGTPRSLTIIGYTDDIGPAEYNAALALRRAQAVYRVLAGAGYPIDKLHIDARPARTPGREERRQMRRVDIVLDESKDMDVNEGQVALNTPASPLRYGRYLEASPTPAPDQRDPLRTIVRVNFPPSVQRIGQALDYLLARSGWQLPASPNLDPTMRNLLVFKLPETQRRLGPVPLVDAVGVLCGEAYEVVLDPIHRLVSCDLKPEFAKLYDKEGRS